ncbi:MAG: hypothetical protein JSS49_11445 [Planctomycetes bacterium]|nr:hypothetical protein [Planctomycetota bacterium]
MPEPRADHPSDCLRLAVRTTKVLVCAALLVGITCVGSRYFANRRLMKLALPQSGNQIDLIIGWRGPSLPSLERWLGDRFVICLMSRPTNLMVQGQADAPTDETVLRVLDSSAGLNEVFIHNRNLPEGTLQTLATRHDVVTLDFQRSIIRPEDSFWLSKMTTLNVVNYRQPVFSNRPNDWSWLNGLPHLRELTVVAHNLQEQELSVLVKSPALKCLIVSEAVVPDDLMARLRDAPNLKYLEINGRQIRLDSPTEYKNAVGSH